MILKIINNKIKEIIIGRDYLMENEIFIPDDYDIDEYISDYMNKNKKSKKNIHLLRIT
jgi:hypothetical protein